MADVHAEIQKVREAAARLLRNAALFPHQGILIEYQPVKGNTVIGYFSLMENITRISHKQFEHSGKVEMIGDEMFELRKGGRHGFEKKLTPDFLSLYPSHETIKSPYFLLLREHDNPGECGITELLGESEYLKKFKERFMKKK